MSKSAQDPNMYGTDLRLDDSENLLVRDVPLARAVKRKWSLGDLLLRI